MRSTEPDFDLGREPGARQVGRHVGADCQNKGGLRQQRAFAVGDDGHPDTVLVVFDRNADRRLLLDQAERATQLADQGAEGILQVVVIVGGKRAVAGAWFCR